MMNQFWIHTLACGRRVLVDDAAGICSHYDLFYGFGRPVAILAPLS